MKIDATLTKIIVAVLIPIIGVPLYQVGYEQMNDSFGGTDEDWAVTIYSIMFVLVFALIPAGVLFFTLRDMNGANN